MEDGALDDLVSDLAEIGRGIHDSGDAGDDEWRNPFGGLAELDFDPADKDRKD